MEWQYIAMGVYTVGIVVTFEATMFLLDRAEYAHLRYRHRAGASLILAAVWPLVWAFAAISYFKNARAEDQ